MIAAACFRLGDLATDLYQNAEGRMRHYTPEFEKSLRQDYERARALLSRCLEIYRRLGDRLGMCWSLGTLGRLERENPEQALSHTREYVQVARELGIAADQAHALHQLGDLYKRLGQYEPARDAFAEALEIYRRLSHGLGYGYARNDLGVILYHLGESEPARELHREGLRIYLDNGMELGVIWSLERYGIVEARYGDAATGAQLLGAASARLEQWGGPASYGQVGLEEALAHARTVLGEEQFHRAFEEGRASDPEWAIHLALGSGESPTAPSRNVLA